MPTHAEKRLLHHTPEQLFDLVADVDKYPEFLPWCVAARVREQRAEEGNEIILADLVIGYKMFRETFTSKVTCRKPGRIDVAYFDGPFKYLNNHWIFEAQGDGDCMIDFYVDFEFKSRLFQIAIGAVFNEAVKMMITAFKKRADALYGIGK
ncbi:MAG: type II toxin-antitoxin system RatA family toxin [Proteobacteria bacterium]|nr:type II toxin-antitoxin system RatA family toxin [Pseudomonadota bacterium]